MYEQTDKSLTRLKKKISREFSKLYELPFDELSVANTTKITTELYERLTEANREEYEDIVDDAIDYALLFLDDKDRARYEKNKIVPKKYVEKVLKDYNPVTDYLYYKETERKRLRLEEGMLTAREYRKRDSFREIIRRSMNLWYTQSKQYAEDMADNTVIEVWGRAGIKYIAWITEEDAKVCDVCDYLGHEKDRSIKIYPIDRVPPKPHYNCRCIKLPVKGDKILTPQGE